MNIISVHPKQAVFAVGDLHGDFGLFRDKIKDYQLNTAIGFICGDFGCGFNHNDPREPLKENRRLSELNTFLKKRNIFIYVVRGNHDNPSFFDGTHNFSNLIFAQDYSVVKVGAHSYVAWGGAVSLDRSPNPLFSWHGRREGIDYWAAERFNYDEEKINKLSDIDVIIAHTRPDFAYPPVENKVLYKWTNYDATLRNDLIEEGQNITKAFNKISEKNNILRYYFGHWHHSNLETINGTTFKLLDCSEFCDINL